jgi:hypothetical protein
MTNQPPAMQDRMSSFMNDCPRAGAEFPDTTVDLLEGEALQLSSLQGRQVVLTAGAFT